MRQAAAMIAVPKSAQEARARLRQAQIPAHVMHVATELKAAGHAAVFVGGAVRDCLLGRAQDDWDLASSATPQEVMAVFRHTIATGVEHGTVTVMVGPRGERIGVEVTTFRGEGEYTDGRRPGSVRFLQDLDEDLARRDFTINAFAWDPTGPDTEAPEGELGRFVDRFGGLADLEAGWVRAVGEPGQRFAEDGLRTMRAVRFCATLGFSLEPATEAAIPAKLEVFDKVARERVRVELFKLLGADEVEAGLGPMARSGLWARVFGAAPPADLGALLRAIGQLTSDPVLRLARVLHGVEDVGDALDALKLSRDDRRRIDLGLSGVADTLRRAFTENEVAFRRAAVAVGRANVAFCLRIGDGSEAVVADAERYLAQVPLSGKELAITGKDLIAAGVAQPGRALGILLAELLAWACEAPGRNQAERLLERAKGRSSS